MKTISRMLIELGVDPSLLGFEYLKTALELQLEDSQYIHAITKRLYPDVAKKHGTTASRVERATRHAVEVCFNTLSPDLQFEYFGHVVPYDKGKVTNSTFIAVLATRWKDEHMQLPRKRH